MISSAVDWIDLTSRDLTTNARLQVGWLTNRAIRALDRLLRHCYAVHEYTDDPECIFRIALRTARSDILLQHGMLVRSGDAIVELHLWNEQLPLISPDGPNMAWGALVHRQIRRSLTLLAIHLVANPNVVAVHGEAALGCRMGQQQRVRFAGRYGFEIVDGKLRLRSRVRHFCDDFLFRGLARTFNPYGLKGEPFHRNRYDIWMSRTELDQRWSTTSTGDRATAENQAYELRGIRAERGHPADALLGPVKPRFSSQITIRSTSSRLTSSRRRS
jgi:hypothetical protein